MATTELGQVDKVSLQWVRQVHSTDSVDHRQYLGHGDDWAKGGDGFIRALRIENREFSLTAGISERQSEQESIELTLGQSIGAFLLDRVLRCNHHERRTQRVASTFNRYLPFFHCFEQCGLGLWRRTIDFIGQHDVGEQRARPEVECFGRTLPDAHAEEVGW